MSGPVANIPKFASFRPKPGPPLTDELKTKDGSHRSLAKDEERQKEPKRRHHRRPHSRTKEGGRESETESQLSQAMASNESPDIFVIDRKGDVKNLVYGSIHRYSVPSFHRFGAGAVLGAPFRMKIDRDYGEETGIVLRDPKDFKAKYREKYSFSKVEKEKPRLLKIRPEAFVEDDNITEADFVPLRPPRIKKPKGGTVDVGESSDSEQEERNYRSIYGNSKSKEQLLDDELQYATESEMSGSETGRVIDIDDSVRKRNIDLSRRVEQTPHDVEAWIALIEHQNYLIGADNNRRRITNAEIRSTADIKIHMYEKALENTTSLKDRERLLLGLMAEGAKIWEVKTQADRWEQLSKDNIDSVMLWTHYLNFKQSTFPTFQYEGIKEVFVKRINLLLKACGSSTTDNAESLYYQLVYVILRLTLFLRESGYTELAVAIWQGLLELNFFPPKQQYSSAQAKALFKDFWESEVPRVGEDGALGWRSFTEMQSSSDAPEPLADGTNDALDIQDPFRTWTIVEWRRAKLSAIPARTMDEVAEDDPFRVILFSDIEDFLILIPPQSQNVRNACLDAFLFFSRLPSVASFNLEEPQRWSMDSFVRGGVLEYDSEWIMKEYLSLRLDQNEEIGSLPSLQIPDQNFSRSPETMFGTNAWFQAKDWRSCYSEDDRSPVSYAWVRNVLKQLTEGHFSEEFAEYFLAFEFLNEPTTIKKISKNLLKRHPASLRLYNAYALIEWSRGEKDVAAGVFSAALQLRDTISESDWNSRSILLWKNWAWLCLEDQENNTALHKLLSIADEELGPLTSLSPTVLIKVQNYFSSNRDYFLSLGDLPRSTSYAECLSLLEYLSGHSEKETTSNKQGDISSALASYTSFSEMIVQRNIAKTSSHELLLQSAARLMFHHARIGPFRPALIRENLLRFLTLFPQNTIFQSLFHWNESRLRIDNRVRNALLSTILIPENDTLTSRLFAIQYEIFHGTIHSVRSAFENALSSPACKSSAGLWRCYILYILVIPQFRPRAKDIWYRALRACPWAKELYLTGFEKMSHMVEFSELKGTWRVMGEKGLRVHVDLEDVFEEIDKMEQDAHKKRRLGHR